MSTQPKYVALDSGNQLVDNGKCTTVRGWLRRARIKMPAYLKQAGFEAFAHVCPMWLTGRNFRYVRMAYGKK